MPILNFSCSDFIKICIGNLCKFRIGSYSYGKIESGLEVFEGTDNFISANILWYNLQYFNFTFYVISLALCIAKWFYLEFRFGNNFFGSCWISLPLWFTNCFYSFPASMMIEGISIFSLWTVLLLMNPSYKNYCDWMNVTDLVGLFRPEHSGGYLCRMCPLSLELCQSPLLMQGPWCEMTANDFRSGVHWFIGWSEVEVDFLFILRLSPDEKSL